MRVLQFIASKGWGGAEKSFVELCNELSKYIQVDVVVFKENQIEERLNKEIDYVGALKKYESRKIFRY